MSNPCPIPGCTGSAHPGQLLCLRHWRMVPSQLKTDVWTTWRAVRFRTGKKAAECAADIATYRAAREAAIASVTSLESPLLPADSENSTTADQHAT